MEEKRIAELILAVRADPRELQELVRLARLGLWAEKYAIVALEVTATGQDTFCYRCGRVGVCAHLLEHAQNALKNKP